MPPEFARLTIPWVVLLFAVMLGASFASIPPWRHVWLIVPAIGIAVSIAVIVRETGRVPRSPGASPAALVWLTILLGFGSMDPLSRTDYHVSGAHPE